MSARTSVSATSGLLIAVTTSVVALLTACSAQENPPAAKAMRMGAPAAAPAAPPPGIVARSQPSAEIAADAAPADSTADPGGNTDALVPRFLAVHHYLQLETGEDDLPQAWQQVQQFCQFPRCEMLTANLHQKTSDSEPSGAQSLRLTPKDFPALLDTLNKAGRLVDHRTESEDKTAQVVDSEARIKNLSELRDRLRKMLGSAKGSVREMVELERELARVQSELDSMQSLRKALANQTEKLAVDISYSVRRSITQRGALQPLAEAWNDAAHTLAQSLAAAINFVLILLPWLLVGWPVFLGLRRGWRWWRGRKAQS